jgi:hypothetical protein
MTISLRALKRRWLKEPGFKEGYDALADEFAVVAVLIEARTRANAPPDAAVCPTCSNDTALCACRRRPQ